MIRLTPGHGLIAAAALLAAGVPAWTLWPEKPAIQRLSPISIDAPSPAPDLHAGLPRPLFRDGIVDIAPPAGAPELVGIIGRLPHDAIAMMRAEDGTTRSLKAGESLAGWRLESLSADAVLMVRGRERVRIALPAIDPQAEPAPQ